MNVATIENVSMIRESVSDFAEKHIRPHIMEWDEAQHFPLDMMREMARHGFLGVLVPIEYHGAGLGYQEYVTVIEEISKVCGSIGLSVAAHNSLCSGHIMLFGTDEQKQKYLTKLATGEALGAWGLTEPTTGSDAMRMKCTATRDGDHYILNGTKSWITHGKSSDIAVVISRGDSLTKAVFTQASRPSNVFKASVTCVAVQTICWRGRG